MTLTGGEPLLHPDIDQIVTHVGHNQAVSILNTNGYLLTEKMIDRLNRAGLDHLFISVDNKDPDPVSAKSLKVLDRKLQLLAQYRQFRVTVNSVLGAGIKNPDDAYQVAARARVGIKQHSGANARSGRSSGAVRQAAPGRVPEAERDAKGSSVLAPVRFVPEQPGDGDQSVALPSGRAIPIYMRARARTLLFAAARAAGYTA